MIDPEGIRKHRPEKQEGSKGKDAHVKENSGNKSPKVREGLVGVR